MREALTLDSGIDVGPIFINFGFFSRRYDGLIREYIGKGYLDGYLLHRTCVSCLFFLPNFPGPTFIPCPMFIPEARVWLNPQFSDLIRNRLKMTCEFGCP